MSQAVERKDNDTVEDLERLIERYFELLDTCDVDQFDQVFDPHAVLYGNQSGSLQVRSAAQYRDSLSTRRSSKEAGANREAEILELDVVSGSIAFAKVKLRSNGERFINYLTFFRFPYGWRIVSKTYCRPSLSPLGPHHSDAVVH